MREPDYWGRLLLGVATIALMTLSACDTDDSHSSGGRPPLVLTIAELGSIYDDTVGNRVILEGQLTARSQIGYFIENPDATGFRIELRFVSDNVDDDKMQPCLDEPTFVTGYLEDSHAIKVQRVKLVADTLSFELGECYRLDQNGPIDYSKWD